MDTARGRTVCTGAARAAGSFGQFLAVLGRAVLRLLLELGVLSPAAGAQVSASGRPLQPLLTPGLFLFPSGPADAGRAPHVCLHHCGHR